MVTFFVKSIFLDSHEFKRWSLKGYVKRVCISSVSDEHVCLELPFLSSKYCTLPSETPCTTTYCCCRLIRGAVPSLMLPHGVNEPIQDKTERLPSVPQILNIFSETEMCNNGSETESPTYYLDIEMPDDCSVTEIPNDCSKNNDCNTDPVVAMTHGMSLEEKYENLKRKYRNQQKLLSKYKIAYRKLKMKNKLAAKSNLSLVTSNTVSSNFFKHQQKQGSRKPMGRRYSVEDKNFAIALYSCSSSSYEFLQRHFPLPAVKSIRKWLKKVEVS